MLRKIRRDRARQEETIRRLKLRRRELLRESGARDEQELRRRAVEAARADVLRRECDATNRDIAAALGSHCPQEAIRQQLEGEMAASLEPRREELRVAAPRWRKNLHSDSSGAARWPSS